MAAKRTNFLWLGACLASAVITGWQGVSHVRTRQAADAQLITRVRDISATLSVMFGTRERMPGIPVRQLKRALNQLTMSSDLKAMGILNPKNEVLVATDGFDASGAVLEPGTYTWNKGHDEFWATDYVVLGERQQAGLVVVDASLKDQFAKHKMPPPADKRRGEAPPPIRPFSYNFDPRRDFARQERLDPAAFNRLYETHGLNKFSVVIDGQLVEAALMRDLSLRLTVSGLSLAMFLGLAYFWKTKQRAFSLQKKLMVADAQNRYLEDLSLSAAGLAHEIRNPLNVVISRSQGLTTAYDNLEQLEQASRVICSESERIHARLNEFINYSKPKAPEKQWVSFPEMAKQLAGAMEEDLDTAGLTFKVSGEVDRIWADPQMLRQILFNLMLNACRYGGAGDALTLVINRVDGGYTFSVKDNGAGVASALTEEIFRPYVTGHEHGTGLGLAVVRKLCLAQDWRITYEAGDPGAIFTVSGITSDEDK